MRIGQPHRWSSPRNSRHCHTHLRTHRHSRRRCQSGCSGWRFGPGLSYHPAACEEDGGGWRWHHLPLLGLVPPVMIHIIVVPSSLVATTTSPSVVVVTTPSTDTAATSRGAEASMVTSVVGSLHFAVLLCYLNH